LDTTKLGVARRRLLLALPDGGLVADRIDALVGAVAAGLLADGLDRVGGAVVHRDGADLLGQPQPGRDLVHHEHLGCAAPGLTSSTTPIFS
jgi:hypothetical protein